MDKEEKITIKKVRCNACNSAQTYVRLKDNTLCCRRCGNVQPMEDDKKW